MGRKFQRDTFNKKSKPENNPRESGYTLVTGPDEYFNEDNQKFYGAATSTKTGLTNFNRLIQQTENTKTLSQLQELAIQIGDATKKKNFVNSLKKQNIWEDLGALKKYLKDDLYMARNKIAENFVKLIERKKEEVNE